MRGGRGAAAGLVFAAVVVTTAAVGWRAVVDDGSSPAPAASSAPSEAVTVVAVGDIACDPAEPDFAGGAGVALACRQRDTAALVRPDDEAVLLLGDLQYEDGALERFRTSFDVSWGRWRDRMRPVPGNHEYYTPGADGYFSYFGSAAGQAGEGWYAFDVGAWRVLALNGECDLIGGCDLESPQVTWLRAELASRPARCTIAYWHSPRFSSGDHPAGPLVDDRAFWNVLYDAGVDVILNAHVHNYERFAPMSPEGTFDDKRGIRQFVVGTGGRSFYQFSDIHEHSEARNAEAFGVLRLTLRDDGYDWRFVPVAGSTYEDSGTDSCH